MREKIGPIQQKILLLLLSGMTLSLTSSAKTQEQVIRSVPKAWREINRTAVQRSIARLYASHLVNIQEHPNGETTYVLSDKGKKRALTFHFEKMGIPKPPHWDGCWRIAVFDIPEKIKPARDALRNKLKILGFYELQKSVFIHPYPCKDELDILIENYGLRRFVRILEARSIDNELHLRRIFKLL